MELRRLATAAGDRSVTARSASVVVCTLDRADALGNLLESLRHLTHRCFEVVVVVGPCSDHTEEVLARWSGRLKVVHNPARNLSASRNLGIAAAAGEIVAFIDDDGIPEPSWLDEIDAAYADDEVAGVGGVVRDHTGYTFQCRFNAANRYGSADPTSGVPLDELCFPGTDRFPYLIGTNSSFRRERLLEVGGFDEEFDFYLDETDVCLRLIDQGWRIRQLPGAEVHHKFMPSDRRGADRITLDLRSVVKNKVYFSLVNRNPGDPMGEALADDAEFTAQLAADLEDHALHGRITDSELAAALRGIDDAWWPGIEAGHRGRVALLDRATAEDPPDLLPFVTIDPPSPRLHVAFVTQSLPPEDPGGIGRYMLDTARELAARGHEVRIITTGHGHDTVDLESGVWVHRVLKGRPAPPSATHADVPERIWNNAAAVAEEVDRIHRRRPLDAVLAAMWDTEALAVMEAATVPVVTTLVTTLGITLPTKPEWQADERMMRDFVEPMLRLERWVIENSTLVHAISEAVLDEAVRVAGAEVDPRRCVVAPLGVPGASDPPEPASPGTGPVVLFVGRLEKRKGIDLFLAAVPAVLGGSPSARVVVIGRDDIPGETGRPPRVDFEDTHAGSPWLDRVEFRGTVDDEELWQAYRDCDVFVAPSRFESFGLVYVEAMRAGRPVVAVDRGAAPEVVVDGVTGLLVEPDPEALGRAIAALLADPDRAEELGRAGYRRYLERFTVDAMAEGAESYLRALVGERR